MKTIANLNGPDFLRQCNRIRHATSATLKNTGVMEIRKQLPAFTGEETAEERKAMEAAQGVGNFNAILDRLLEEKPEETYKLLKLLCVPEEGDPEDPDGLTVAMAGLEVLADSRVIGFLSSLMKSGLIDMVS